MSALKVNKTAQHDKNLVLGFKDYYSNLTGKLLKKFPDPPPPTPRPPPKKKKITLNTVFQHNLATVSEKTILKNTKVSKAADLDNLSGGFLKDGGKVLAKLITGLYNL